MNLNLHPHEVRRLLDAGECLIVRPVKWKRDKFDVAEPLVIVKEGIDRWRFRHGTKPIQDESIQRPPFGPPGTRLVGK